MCMLEFAFDVYFFSLLRFGSCTQILQHDSLKQLPDRIVVSFFIKTYASFRMGKSHGTWNILVSYATLGMQDPI